ncbi:MAG: UDP-N-acetylglucosamine--N-acetylmuramyl-(pentapeptide) pyrophosphoryl-undecaprenol N-acetylglucosamine transferase [Parcubacteria group bacterium]|nr:UDP-N-acetylglucosamine--N-acetylmuramyl-(pentapeptide) pyrophosphoryl-undecaprenol N-acetylglucosamine transferase [Parcubacteria group bacterium]
MKIVLTGGGTAGHFYPLIAIAEALNSIAKEEKLVPPRLYYMSNEPLDEALLFDNNVTFTRVSAGKLRRYFSLLNVVDLFKTAFGVLGAIGKMFLIYPDVVISKGGYVSFPPVLAARILRIPIIVHESDTVPGRTNLWAGTFADRVAVSWPEAAEYFKGRNVALTGQPVRKGIQSPAKEGAHEYLKLEEGRPVILVWGGSQGAQVINRTLLDILPELLAEYQIIHQAGEGNVEEVKNLAKVILKDDTLRARYKPFGYLNTLALRMSAGVASLVISRAGSGLFEIAAWGLPSIIIPITESNGDHQRRNAFNYARSGACVVIEEKNLAPHVLLSEIQRLMQNETERRKMGDAAKAFFMQGAPEKIAREAITIALSHE